MTFKHRLTPRQREVWELVEEQGKSIQAVAKQLGISPKTVQKHLRNARAAWTDSYKGITQRWWVTH